MQSWGALCNSPGKQRRETLYTVGKRQRSSCCHHNSSSYRAFATDIEHKNSSYRPSGFLFWLKSSSLIFTFLPFDQNLSLSLDQRGWVGWALLYKAKGYGFDLGQGACLGCGFSPGQGACERQPIDISLSH